MRLNFIGRLIMINRRNKRGQVGIYIIIAIAIVAIIVVVLLFVRKDVDVTPTFEGNPQAFIDKCVREAVLEAVDIMLPQGGFIAPENVKLYQNMNISYLCENIGNYHSCINQHPMLLNEMKVEIDEYITPKVENCFETLQDELEDKGDRVEMTDMQLEVAFAPRRIYVDIDRILTIDRGEDTTQFKEFNSEISSPTYDLANIAIEIATNEAKYCYFEYVGYMILYPKYSIEKYAMSDSTKIYTIKDKATQLKMNIAIRSCAIPPGI